MQMGLLERCDPMSQDFEDKLGHLEGAVQHHVYQEESEWFIDLVDNAPDADHRQIAERYDAEFNRYMGAGANERSPIADTYSPGSGSSGFTGGLREENGPASGLRDDSHFASEGGLGDRRGYASGMNSEGGTIEPQIPASGQRYPTD